MHPAALDTSNGISTESISCAIPLAAPSISQAFLRAKPSIAKPIPQASAAMPRESLAIGATTCRPNPQPETRMNILRLSIALLTYAAAGAHAADRTGQTALDSIAVRADARVVVDCRNERVPTLRSVADVLETNNGSRAYAERERLVHIAHRECLRGASSVAFVRDASESVPALATVDHGAAAKGSSL
jgi:hypothetical protein